MTEDMHVKDLRNILNKLPDELLVIIPVVDEDDVNHIIGFRKVRTAGILLCGGEEEPEAICLNGAMDGQDIADQIHFSGKSSDISVKDILFGDSKFGG